MPKSREEGLKQRKQYREANREVISARAKKYYLDNRKTILKRMKSYRIDNYEMLKQREMKNKYGLSHRDWAKIWEGQNGKCAICGKPFTKSANACVDHNHKTGTIRGLLCLQCNFAIGLLGDNQNRMTKALQYIHKWDSLES